MIKEERVRKIYAVFVVILISLSVIFIIFQNSQLNYLYEERLNSYERVVGYLVDKYPESEIEIVNSLISEGEVLESQGEKILKKYGYESGKAIGFDNSFIDVKDKFITRSMIFILAIFIVMMLIIVKFTKVIFGYLFSISNVLSRFIDGDYEYDDEFNEEGIVNIIGNQLCTLGKNISTKYAKLEDEKESAKSLVTDISHQLKTPLSSLTMCNDLLTEEELSAEERKEFLQISRKNINKLHGLIDSLVNISRLEAAMIKLRPVNNNIKDTILNAYNNAYVKARNKGIALEINNIFDEQIYHDRKWTEEAIFNVIDNGIKYAEEGSRIVISMEDSLNYLKISIADNGHGIDKKDFNNIFKRFYRGRKYLESEIEGAGVGLYLTRKILEDQGGNIFVKSKVGQGSKFTILLPKT